METNIYNEYQIKAAVTAIYPGRLGATNDGKDLTGIYYTAMGLAGESGELLEKYFSQTRFETEDIVKEIGDVLWYLSQCAMELGSTFNYIYDSINRKACCLSGVFLISISAAKYCETVKKCLRDNHGHISKDIRKKLLEFLSNSLIGVLEVSNAVNKDISEIMDTNIEKLSCRQKNGTLGGSGDNR